MEEGTQPISHEDYERLIQYLEKKNPPAILPIQIAYYAGLRIGETCGLTWQDINLEEQCLTIKRRDVYKRQILLFLYLCNHCFHHGNYFFAFF